MMVAAPFSESDLEDAREPLPRKASQRAKLQHQLAAAAREIMPPSAAELRCLSALIRRERAVKGHRAEREHRGRAFRRAGRLLAANNPEIQVYEL